MEENWKKIMYTLSHDLKAPLRSIDQLALWIDEDKNILTEDSKKYMGWLRERIYQMTEMIETIEKKIQEE